MASRKSETKIIVQVTFCEASDMQERLNRVVTILMSQHEKIVAENETNPNRQDKK